MVLSPRGVLAIGLSLAGIAYLVAPSRGQAQQAQKADGGVRPAANRNRAAVTGPRAGRRRRLRHASTSTSS